MALKKPSIWWLPLFGIFFLQSIWYIASYVVVLRKPDLGGSDFLSFYTAGRIAQLYELEQLYNLALQSTIQAEIIGPNFVAGGALPYMHPPFLAPVLGLFMSDNFHDSFLLWGLFLWILTFFSALLVYHFLRLQEWTIANSVLAALASFLFYPIFISIFKGQDTVLLFLGAWGAMWALSQDRERLAGIALGLTVIRPQLALLLALPFIFARREVWWSFCLSGGLLTLLSMGLIGPNGVGEYIELILITAQGSGYGIQQVSQFNFMGLILRLAPGLSPSLVQAMKWGLFSLSIGLLCWLWWRQRTSIQIHHFALAITVSIFASPHLHNHDLSLLLLPLLVLVSTSVKRWQWSHDRALLALAGSSLFLMLSDYLPGMWRFIGAYLLMGVLAITLSQITCFEVGQDKPASVS